MEIENALGIGENYKTVLLQAKQRLPEGTDEQTIRRTAWLYIQYGCNNYTDGPGYPFRAEDVQDAVKLDKHAGMALAGWLEALGVLEKGDYDRYHFAERWM